MLIASFSGVFGGGSNSPASRSAFPRVRATGETPFDPMQRAFLPRAGSRERSPCSAIQGARITTHQSLLTNHAAPSSLLLPNINPVDSAPYHRIIMCLACGYPSNPRPLHRVHVLALCIVVSPGGMYAVIWIHNAASQAVCSVLSWTSSAAGNPLSDYWRRNTDAQLNPFRGLYQLNTFDLAIMLPYFFVHDHSRNVRDSSLRPGLQLLQKSQARRRSASRNHAMAQVTVQLPIL